MPPLPEPLPRAPPRGKTWQKLLDASMDAMQIKCARAWPISLNTSLDAMQIEQRGFMRVGGRLYGRRYLPGPASRSPGPYRRTSRIPPLRNPAISVWPIIATHVTTS